MVAAGRGPKRVDIALEPLNPETRHGQSVKWKSTQPDALVIDENAGLPRPRLQSGNPLVSTHYAATNIAKSTTVYVEFPGTSVAAAQLGGNHGTSRRYLDTSAAAQRGTRCRRV